MKNNNCILCQSNNKTVIARQEFKDEFLSLIDPELNKIERTWVECGNCKLIYHNPRLEEFETDILYKKFRDPSFTGEIADEYFDKIISIPNSESDNFYKVTQINNDIPEHISKGGSILDIGSGGGVFLYTFLQRNKYWTSYGVEPTAEFANLTQRKLQCPVHAGNYHKDIFDTKFDLITCNQVLEHTIDPMKFLGDIFSDLNRGGYLYMEVPDTKDFEELSPEHNRFWMAHLWYFSKPVLENMFAKSGFKVIKVESQKTIRGRNNLVSLLLKE
jgi:2-polyprenyl-3-methyl-5-hydroxy-6-metoxy-1,4-benzoquinol methylase